MWRAAQTCVVLPVWKSVRAGRASTLVLNLRRASPRLSGSGSQPAPPSSVLLCGVHGPQLSTESRQMYT